MTARRRTLDLSTVIHPETGQTIEVKVMEGGGVVISLPNPKPSEPMRWALSGMFTGGRTGTNLSLVRIDDPESC